MNGLTRFPLSLPTEIPVATPLSSAAVATKSTDLKKVAIERAKAKPQTTIFVSTKKGEDIKKVKETFVKSVDPTYIFVNRL
jgi:hypothetical protein